MRKQPQMLINAFGKLVFLGASLFLFVSEAGLKASYSQQVGDPDVPKDREIHNTFSDSAKNGTILDAANPMDLINRLRQATAMDDATSPSDAIDQALQAFDQEDFDSSEKGPKSFR